MLENDSRLIEDRYGIFIRSIYHINGYYRIIDGDYKHLWTFSIYPFEKMNVRPVTVEDILFLDQDQKVISAYVVNNHVLSIETIPDYLYYNHQILCTMGDAVQISVQSKYDVPVAQKIADDLVDKCLGYYSNSELKTAKQQKNAIEHAAFALFYRYIMYGRERCISNSIQAAYPLAYQKLKAHLEASDGRMLISNAEIVHYSYAFQNLKCL